jgi:hypothetical protein
MPGRMQHPAQGGDKVRILGHLLNVFIFCGLFLIGKLMMTRNHRWADSMVHNPKTAQGMSKFFRYGGGFFQVVGAIGSLIDSVAVLVLISHAVLDLAFGM